MRVPSSCVLAVACASCVLYSPGSFSSMATPFVGKRVALGCIELTATQTEDARATGPVIAYSFGNRCFHSVHVDLSSIRAYGRYADGTRPLHAYDPRHELRSMQIDGWYMGSEEIEYLADDGSVPSAACVDVGRVDLSASPTAHWLCFGTWDLGDGASEHYGKSDGPPGGAAAAAATGWPLAPELDPAVTTMPANAQLSIEGVGGYLASRISDPHRLVKALHDYVIVRLDYDERAKAAIEHERWAEVPSQEAEDVFQRRTAVCAGYAHLLVALGKAAGVEVAYVTGFARGADTAKSSAFESHPHAWNAAKLDGEWVLIDTTWDDQKTPISTYLMTPPALFAREHIPDEVSWQLLAPPLTLDDFARQPMLGGGR